MDELKFINDGKYLRFGEFQFRKQKYISVFKTLRKSDNSSNFDTFEALKCSETCLIGKKRTIFTRKCAEMYSFPDTKPDTKAQQATKLCNKPTLHHYRQMAQITVPGLEATDKYDFLSRRDLIHFFATE